MPLICAHRRRPAHQRQEAFLRGQLDRRVGAAAGDADLDLGQRLRDDVPALALPDLAVPVERLRRLPGLEDQVDRLAEHDARIGRHRPALLVVGDIDADAEAGDVAAVGEMVADRAVGRDLQRMEERQRADAGPILICLVSAAALQMSRSALGSWSGAWKARKVPCSLIQASFMPSRSATMISCEVLVVARLGQLVVAVAVREKTDLHRLLPRTADGWRWRRALSSRLARAPHEL